MNRILLSSMVLAASWPAWASAEGRVVDSAHLFSADAAQSAQTAMKEFHNRTGLDFVVETVDSAADVDVTEKGRSAEQLDREWQRAAKSRAEAKGVHGLYVLICKDPPKLRYQSTSRSIRSEDEKAVKEAMLQELRKNEFDKSLAAGTAALARINVATPARPAGRHAAEPAAASGGSMIWTVLLIGLGLWLLVGVMRGLSMGGGSGGFFSSLLGGMFGGMAGMWLYDSFFRGGGGWSGDSGSDAGSSGGGDWGDSSSGGGDWGGGGDLGSGGDYGGGGDF